MTEQNWTTIVENFIVRGDIPTLRSGWDVEEPETYLQRIYNDADNPSDVRDAVIAVLSEALQHQNADVLRRGLRFCILAPHTDFASILQEIFFTLRTGKYAHSVDDTALLALRGMQVLQSKLPTTSPVRSVWQAMWLALLGDSKLSSGDPKFGLAAFQGLRHLDTSLAFHYLPLLLRRSDLPFDDLRVILRGLKRDGHKHELDLVNHLSDAIGKLTEEEFITYSSPLEDSFTEKVVSTAAAKARKEVEEDIEQECDLQNFRGDSPVRNLHDRVFPKLADWLRRRLPVEGVSMWLVDKTKRQVHFRGQSGCPGEHPSPPRIFSFDEFTAGRVASSRKSEFVDLTNPDSPAVYMKAEFLSCGMTGLFSVYAQTDQTLSPPLALVINYFDKALDRLRRIEEPCTRNAYAAVRICQRLFEKYTSAMTSELTDLLTLQPTLAEAANTFVENIGAAIPSTERIALYLFDADHRTLFLYTLYNTETRKHSNGFLGNKELITVKPGGGLPGYTSERTQPVRISNLMSSEDLRHLRLAEGDEVLSLNLDLSNDRMLNYLGVSLREPAPVGFAGLLGGVVEIFRSTDDETKVFTPVGEHLFSELAKVATPFMLRAYINERRFNKSIPISKSEIFLSHGTSEDFSDKLRDANQSLRDDLRLLLNHWQVTEDSKRAFFAFRTLPEKCKAFWSIKSGCQFSDDEKQARIMLQQSILAHDERVLSREPACAITPDFLKELLVPERYWQSLLPLGLVLVTLTDRNQLAGMIGLEFGSEREAVRIAERVTLERDELDTQFVRTSIMRTWLSHRRHLRTLFGDSLEQLSLEAQAAGNLGPRALFNFMASGRADLRANEKSFNELMAVALRNVPSDAKCDLREECANWERIAIRGALHTEIEPVELMELPSAMRMMLATSTAPMLWGNEAHVKLDPLGEKPGWLNLTVNVPKNGHEEVRQRGFNLAKAISEYRGWDYSDEDEETINVMLPSVDA